MGSFNLVNNSVRSYGFAGRLCVAGAGCPTPPKAAETGFKLDPRFPMSESEMFKSFRGVLDTMKTVTPQGVPAIQVFIDGVKDPLSEQDLLAWAEEQRKERGWASPGTRQDHAVEVERAMDRPEDPLETLAKQGQDERDARLVRLVISALRAERDAAAPPPPAPAKKNNDAK